jgi:hypothetical protein
LCSEDINIIALACDEQPEQEIAITVLPLNDENVVCEFISRLVKRL